MCILFLLTDSLKLFDKKRFCTTATTGAGGESKSRNESSIMKSKQISKKVNDLTFRDANSSSITFQLTGFVT